MNLKVRAGQLAVAFIAALALVVGSTFFGGGRFWAFSAAVILVSAWALWVLFRRASRGWLTESYRLLGEARLAELRPRVEQELQRSASGVDRPVVEQLWAETVFWSGEPDRAYELATAIDTSRMSDPWRGAVAGLRVTSSIFGGHLERARELLVQHRALLEKRPGLHHLEALIALKSGDAKAARERFESLHEDFERPRLVRAALALVEAQIGAALEENVEEQLERARSLGGESWVPKAAAALEAERSTARAADRR